MLLEWSEQLDMYLRVVITLEGRGTDPPLTCQGGEALGRGICSNDAVYRCVTCDNGGLLCSGCMVECHHRLPLHRIQVW